jgi:hypothetical protein
MKALIERRTQEADSLTVAIADGVAISTSAEAAAQWRSSHGHAGTNADAQNATIGRLAAMFPGAVRVTH